MLGIFGIVPEAFFSDQNFNFFKPFFFSSKVKDSLVIVLISEKVPLFYP